MLAVDVKAPPAEGAPLVEDASPEYFSPVLGPPIVVRHFDPPAQRWLPGHRGVDLAVRPAALVRAAGAGVVAFSGTVVSRPVVSVDHADGVRTTYEPVDSELEAGDRIGAGQVIGRLYGVHDGCPATACLHWGARIGDEYIDPMSLLGMSGAVIRLKPLEPGD